MLRASIPETGHPLDPRPIVSGAGCTGVPGGAELIAFTDAVVLGDVDEYDAARATLAAVVGRAGADRAAMVAGNFSMMNRALDAIGAPVDPGHDALAAEMGLSVPDHLRTHGPR